jgi:hypothetical protein
MLMPGRAPPLYLDVIEFGNQIVVITYLGRIRNSRTPSSIRPPPLRARWESEVVARSISLPFGDDEKELRLRLHAESCQTGWSTAALGLEPRNCHSLERNGGDGATKSWLHAAPRKFAYLLYCFALVRVWRRRASAPKWKDAATAASGEDAGPELQAHVTCRETRHPPRRRAPRAGAPWGVGSTRGRGTPAGRRQRRTTPAISPPPGIASPAARGR